jgi:2-polyprenyl-3-methyl-5-hydroxy-6-metoxy-1,4-benzoquinol methylase
MSHEARIKQSWLDNAAAWTTAVREGQIASRRAGTDAAIVDTVLKRRPSRLLDAGCGEGWLSRAIARHGVEVTGFDGSSHLIETAKQSGAAHFLHLTYEDFVAHPAQAGRLFDAVVFNFSLFAENIVPVLTAARRVMQKQGSLLIQTVHPFNDAVDEHYVDGWREENFENMPGEFRTPMPWYFRTMQSWINSVIRAGFRIAELREPLDADAGRALSLIIVATSD